MPGGEEGAEGSAPRRVKREETEKDEDGKEDRARGLDEEDVEMLRAYGHGPHDRAIEATDKGIIAKASSISALVGVRETDTGLAPPSMWDLDGDQQTGGTLHVAMCTKIINPGDDAKYVINIKHVGKYVVALGDQVAPSDIEESARVGVSMVKYKIERPLPNRVDATVSMMQVEERPDVTYQDVGGLEEQKVKVQEVVELPMMHPERFLALGIDPPKGLLLYGPPGTGKTLLARAVANSTDACFIRIIGSELVQRYVGEGARMVRELFQLARSKRAAILFFDEIDAIGGTRHGDEGGFGDNEVQRTMLEIVNQLDGFDSRGNVKVMMATNRPDTLDPALTRPGRMDRKIEFALPDLRGRAHIFKIHMANISHVRPIRYELLSRLCPSSTGADIRSVCTEAGMFAIRDRRKAVTEKDLIDAVNKVIKGYKKFSATPTYLAYN